MTTYLLVHGAWHNGHVWERVAPLLTASGHRVFAPSLTGHGDKADRLGPDVGLGTHAGDVVDLIVREDLRDVVLVGHSYGGLVVSAAANAVPERIGKIVYLDAAIPRDGESMMDVVPATHRMIAAAATSSSPWRIPPISELPPPGGLFGITDPADIAWVKSLLGDESVRCFQEPVRMDNPALTAVPREYVLCVDTGSRPGRRPFPVTQPNGDPVVVHELHSGHDCMVTAPREVAALLLELGSGRPR